MIKLIIWKRLNNKFIQKWLSFTPVFLVIIIFGSSQTYAFSMDSSNYQIEEDSINFMGEPSSSLHYKLNESGGEVGTGESTSSHYVLGAGFWGAAQSTISISGSSVINMGDISGTGFSSLTTNSGTWNVKTDNDTGYTLQWRAQNVNMVSGSDTLGPFVPTVGGTPNTWSGMPNTVSWWGGHLGKDSTTTDTAKWGTLDTYAGGKWLNVGTSDYSIVSRPSSTTTSGDNEVIYAGAEVGTNKIQPTGTYSVIVILTAIAL
ncbi:MAG: hypothetical protein WCI63_04120 [bacterium]